MEYSEAINYLYGLERFGVKLGLKNIRVLSKLLGSPHKSLKAIHLTGTNGKGSVAAMLASILQAQGYKVGLYTSPHLSRFTERITINGKEIPEDKVVELTELIKPLAEKVAEITGGHPTFFEFTTALAFKYFADEKIDFAVLEVGMGGRLDATNIIRPLVSVITNVALEHTQYLGESIEKIAFEKAGIIKNGISVVTAANDPRALSVIKKICKKRASELFRVGKDVKFKAINQTLRGQKLDVNGILRSYKNLFVPLLGKFQVVNTATAIATLECLQKSYNLAISREAIRKGLAEVRWPGRLELFSTQPLVLLDCAHNPAGSKALRQELENIKKRKILVVGISSDKAIPSILKELVPCSELVIATQAKVADRAMPAEELAKEVLKYKNTVVIAKDVKEAVNFALSSANKNDSIIITGSIFVVGEARDCLSGRKWKN